VHPEYHAKLTNSLASLMGDTGVGWQQAFEDMVTALIRPTECGRKKGCVDTMMKKELNKLAREAASYPDTRRGGLVFVLSGDRDFASELAALVTQGFLLVLVHRGNVTRSRAVEQHCHLALDCWDAILGAACPQLAAGAAGGRPGTRLVSIRSGMDEALAAAHRRAGVGGRLVAVWKGGGDAEEAQPHSGVELWTVLPGRDRLEKLSDDLDKVREELGLGEEGGGGPATRPAAAAAPEISGRVSPTQTGRSPRGGAARRAARPVGSRPRGRGVSPEAGRAAGEMGAAGAARSGPIAERPNEGREGSGEDIGAIGGVRGGAGEAGEASEEADVEEEVWVPAERVKYVCGPKHKTRKVCPCEALLKRACLLPPRGTPKV
jgi:hypothetical protein